MGCCISKCRSQHNNIKNVVQDKLVISQQVSPPIIPSPIISPNNPHHHHRFLPPSKYKISPSPPSPTSSFTCTAATTTTISSSSSSSLSSASSFTSKDRSFSNEFLWSCYKDNPQITRINSLTHHAATSLPFSNNQKPNKTTINVNPSPPPPPPPPHSLLNHRLPGSSSSQKRLRSNSPTNLTRQKSFRKDSSQQQPQLESINSNRPLRMLIGSSPSPSPSRRFTEYSGNSSSMDNTTSIVSKRRNNGNNSPKVISSVHHSYSRCSSSNSVRNNNKAAASPNNSASLGRLQCSGLRHRAMTRTLRVGSKIDENVVKQVVSNANNNNDMDLDIIEDIDNPLISLDCFIFL